MDEIKKIVNGFTPSVAAMINAGFAGVFVVLFFLLGAVPLSWIFKLGFSAILVWLVTLGLAIAAGVWPFIKQKTSSCMVYSLLLIFFASSGLGSGAIIILLLVLIPWFMFVKLRTGEVKPDGVPTKK